MSPANRAAVLDVATVAGVHLIPLALVLAGRFDTIDLLLAYTVETALGLILLLARLTPRLISFWPGLHAFVKMAPALAAIGLVLVWFIGIWAVMARRVVDAAPWDESRVLFAALTGLGLAGYTWYAFRRGERRGLGIGRQAGQMCVLIAAVYFGLAATDSYLVLTAHGWEPSHITDTLGHVLATHFTRLLGTLGVAPEAFAAIVVGSLMAFNEAAATALRHLGTPPEDPVEPEIDLRRR